MKYKNPLNTYKSNIFLTGPGGTGKTYAIHDYISDHPNTALCASTGTAAVNIGGSTAHRLFSIPVPAYGADPNKVAPSQLKVFDNIDTVIIDEISMLRNDAFSFAIRVLHRAEALLNKKIRVIVAGDFSQLAPVVKKSEEKYFTKYGFDKSGFCFTTKEWKDLKFKPIVLSKIYRQSNVEFITQLAEARSGNKGCIPYFNSFVKEDIPEDAVYLCGTNAEADNINQEYLFQIKVPITAYQAKKQGITGKELPCDDVVLIKPGCQVMFTANDNTWASDRDTETGDYTNGLLGTVIEARSNSVIVETEDGRTIEVEPHRWSIYKYTVDRGTSILKKEEIGSIKQIPLKVAKAITIHKSQGKTFSKMVLSPRTFAAGQLYVALSRIRDPEGLYLTEPIIDEYLKIDSKINKFYNNNFKWDIPAAQLKKQKEIAQKQKNTSAKKKKTTTSKKRTIKTKATKRKSVTKKNVAKKSATKKSVKKPTKRSVTVKKRASSK